MKQNKTHKTMDVIAYIAFQARDIRPGDRLALASNLPGDVETIAADVCARLNSELPRNARTHYEVQRKHGAVAIAHVQD